MVSYIERCRSCGALIMFAKTVKGKFMPVNDRKVCFMPSKDGKGLFITEDGEALHGTEINERDDDADLRFEELKTGYISHFATCPNAEKWRKKK